MFSHQTELHDLRAENERLRCYDNFINRRERGRRNVMALMCGDIEVTKGIYHLACFFTEMEELKKLGLVCGGPEINLKAFEAIKYVGESAGLPEPTKEEIARITMFFSQGGEWEDLIEQEAK